MSAEDRKRALELYEQTLRESKGKLQKSSESDEKEEIEEVKSLSVMEQEFMAKRAFEPYAPERPFPIDHMGLSSKEKEHRLKQAKISREAYLSAKAFNEKLRLDLEKKREEHNAKQRLDSVQFEKRKQSNQDLA
jgi:hypothetical protein